MWNRRLAPWVLAVAMISFAALGMIRLYSSGIDPILSTADEKRKARQEECGHAPWGLNGNDLGMVLLDIPTRQAALAFHVPEPGVYVLAVNRNSPAGLAGMQPGDRIAGLNGTAVISEEDLTSALEPLKNGDTVEMTVKRGLNRITVTLDMGEGKEQL